MIERLGARRVQPGHRAGLQRRLPAAVLQAARASRCSASSRPRTPRRSRSTRGSRRASSSGARTPRARSPPRRRPTCCSATTSSPTCPDINDFVAGHEDRAEAPAARSRSSSRTCSSSSSSTSGTRSTTSTSRTCPSRPSGASSRRTACACSTSQELPTHGGSLRIFGCHADDPRERSATPRASCSSASARPACEDVADLPRLRRARRRGQAPDPRRSSSTLKRAGNSIAGYGAAAKGNTLLNYCGVGRDFLDFTCDANPHKQGHVLPGTHIPILAPDAIRERRPDVVLILPWNIKDEIMRAALVHPGVGRALRGAVAGAAAVRMRLVATPLDGRAARRAGAARRRARLLRADVRRGASMLGADRADEHVVQRRAPARCAGCTSRPSRTASPSSCAARAARSSTSRSTCGRGRATLHGWFGVELSADDGRALLIAGRLRARLSDARRRHARCSTRWTRRTSPRPRAACAGTTRRSRSTGPTRRPAGARCPTRDAAYPDVRRRDDRRRAGVLVTGRERLHRPPRARAAAASAASRSTR